ncbi:B mating type pheromone [Pleurotus ostreatus PC15]|uniref:B mating type pheromone n=1 Tax=Pleurotus ostreatus (strain PC15) TaxID=1137138 RepID=A0A067N6H0_PLEO1|nr:B mating type pheromone [Pleurotus ostreatus PC15]
MDIFFTLVAYIVPGTALPASSSASSSSTSNDSGPCSDDERTRSGAFCYCVVT